MGNWQGKGRNPGTFPWRGEEVLGRWDNDLGFRNIPCAELGPAARGPRMKDSDLEEEPVSL